MEMHTVYFVPDPAADRLKQENRRLNRACSLLRRMAIVATAVLVLETFFYLAVLARMDSVHKTIESASHTRIAAAQQEAALYKSMLDCYESMEVRP